MTGLISTVDDLPQFSQYKSTRYFGSLDALRAFAIICVLWQHSPPIPHSQLPFVDIGGMGVGLFFTLSGFLITTLLLREQDLTGTISLKKFYIRRSLRILPLYYMVLLTYTVIVLLREHNAAGRLFISNLPYYITYTNNWFVDLIVNEDGQRRVIFVFAWTLATEQQFYLFWPSMFKYLDRRKATLILVGIIFAVLLLRITLGEAKAPTTLEDRLLRIVTSPSPEICLGVLVALTLHSPVGYSRAWKILGRKWSSVLFGVLTLVVAMWPGGLSYTWQAWNAVVLALLVASVVIREDHALAFILQNKVLVRIGVVSYGIYLIHMLAINTIKVVLTKSLFLYSVVAFLSALLLAYLAAEISFNYFESPILRLKGRLKANPAKAIKQFHDAR